MYINQIYFLGFRSLSSQKSLSSFLAGLSLLRLSLLSSLLPALSVFPLKKEDQFSIKLATPAKLPSGCLIYLLKESDFHLPCCMICSTEAPFCAKAVVPPILKECPLMFP